MGSVDLHTARRARARAFLADALAKGKAWATKPYSYDFERDDAMFPLGWYDDDKKKTTATKMAEAVAAYVNKFSAQPNLILVNEVDKDATYPGCEVKAEKRVGPNIYHVGRQE